MSRQPDARADLPGSTLSEIRSLDPVDREAAARMLARAFVDNPLNRAVVPGSDSRRYRSNLHGMRALLAAAHGAADVRIVKALGAADAIGPRAALVAMGPGAFPLPPAPIGVQLRAALGQGPRALARWNRVFLAFQEVHPVVRHWYLGVLGVDPAVQRQGLGRALLDDWLIRVDEEQLPSYLETDREANIAFYGAAGFELSREVAVLGVPVWCMWRPTRARGATA